jgi:hypothetical protein
MSPTAPSGPAFKPEASSIGQSRERANTAHDDPRLSPTGVADTDADSAANERLLLFPALEEELRRGRIPTPSRPSYFFLFRR